MRTHFQLLSVFGVLSLILSLLVAVELIAQAPRIESKPLDQGAPMRQFVLIFHQSAQPLSEAQLKKRTEEVREWVLRHRREGRTVEPRILSDRVDVLGLDVDHSENASNGKVIALNFMAARDWDEALRIVRTHPGLTYGVSIELREWSSPISTASQSPNKTSGKR